MTVSNFWHPMDDESDRVKLSKSLKEVKKILLVGCGNIGFRHLEGLLNTEILL